MARRYEGSVQFVGMGSRDRASALEGFVDKYDLGGFPHAADEDGGLRSSLGVFGQPTWVFIAADGSVERSFGELGEAGLVAALERMAP